MNTKCFADDTSLFPVVDEVNTSVKEIIDNLIKFNNWAFQQK